MMRWKRRSAKIRHSGICSVASGRRKTCQRLVVLRRQRKRRAMNKTLLFRLAFRWLPHVPRGLVRGAVEAAALGAYAFAATTRRRVRRNLRHIPTLAANPLALERATRRAFRFLMLNYMDLFVPPPADALLRFPIRNIEALRAVQAAGRGCIFLAVHSAAFEWGRYAMP